MQIQIWQIKRNWTQFELVGVKLLEYCLKDWGEDKCILNTFSGHMYSLKQNQTKIKSEFTHDVRSDILWADDNSQGQWGQSQIKRFMVSLTKIRPEPSFRHRF